MHRTCQLVAALVACLIPTIGVAAEMLNIGDAAPPLAVGDWVKGHKIEHFEPRKTYVVEFWATWCGPCRASIPHLTELAHRHKDVPFIGVDVFEDDTSLVKPFIEEMGDKMDYNVVLDAVPENGKSSEGAMAKGWMEAADEHGIPTAFVVHDGRIAWIGHPNGLEAPLAKIVTGEWNFVEMAKDRIAVKEQDRKWNAVSQKVFGFYNAQDFKGTVTAIDEATADDAKLGDALAPLKFKALCRGGDIATALELGEKLFEKQNDNADGLNDLAWDVIDPALEKEPDPRVVEFALRAARRAVEITKGEDAFILDTFAAALFRSGDFAGAVGAQEKAVKLYEPMVKDPEDRTLKELKEHLERYRKATT